jgi:hypothetical protein
MSAAALKEKSLAVMLRRPGTSRAKRTERRPDAERPSSTRSPSWGQSRGATQWAWRSPVFINTDSITLLYIYVQRLEFCGIERNILRNDVCFSLVKIAGKLSHDCCAFVCLLCAIYNCTGSRSSSKELALLHRLFYNSPERNNGFRENILYHSINFSSQVWVNHPFQFRFNQFRAKSSRKDCWRVITMVTSCAKFTMLF